MFRDVVESQAHYSVAPIFRHDLHPFSKACLHLVLAATEDRADFQRFMANWKQRAGYQYKQRSGECLWQDSYFDHVLRDDEETGRAIKYALEKTGLKPCATLYYTA